MNRSSTFRIRRRVARGFTLLEILIVGSIIALFAGIAIFGMQEFYEAQRGKVMFDETKQLGTALGLAQHDVGFFPRLYTLSYAKSEVVRQVNNIYLPLRPGFDSYGQYSQFDPGMGARLNAWTGFYMGMTGVKGKASRSPHRGIVKMRLSDSEAVNPVPPLTVETASLVDWPLDTWGNPYMVYLVSTSTDKAYVTTKNPKGLHLITRPTELPNFFCAVVSYGPNGIPGGLPRELENPQPAPNPAFLATLERASLYTKEDQIGTGGNFTLKSFSATGTLQLGTPAFNDDLAVSLEGDTATNINNVGIMDRNSDDVY